jgi:putative component of membrane protein insertase Oxa1/YidC/SpoIIIJ protein YidD
LRIVALVVALASCRPVARVGSPCAGPAAFAPFDARVTHAPPELPATGVLDQLVTWYQRSSGERAPLGIGCPFAPTCSVYARRAIARMGPFAIVAIVDRLLVREHPLAGAYYPTTCADHTLRLADEVP